MSTSLLPEHANALATFDHVQRTRLVFGNGMAARTGQAVGIGHDREATLSALTNVLPRLETRGFRFVPISRLLP